MSLSFRIVYCLTFRIHQGSVSSVVIQKSNPGTTRSVIYIKKNICVLVSEQQISFIRYIVPHRIIIAALLPRFKHRPRRNLGEPGVAAEKGDGSGDVACGNERHDADHGKTAIVELSAAFLLKSFRVYAGEVELGEDNLGERTTLGVVGALGLGLKLRKEDGSDDLGLAGEGDRLPGIEGVHLR